MNRKRLTSALLTLGFVLVVLDLVFLVRGPIMPVYADEPKRFQYKIVDVLPDTQLRQTTMNQYGNDGWELVAVSMGDLTAPRLVFKR